MSDKQCFKKPHYEYVKQVENALHTIEWLIGRNTFHEHQRLVGYLQGWLAGQKFTENELENEKELNKGIDK